MPSISILQYIEGGNVSVKNEISKIESGGTIDIRIEHFFINSPDLKKVYTEISLKQQMYNAEIDESIKTILKKELAHLFHLEKIFKIELLKLAELFVSLPVMTERLTLARTLFDEGKFSEADAVLIERKLSNEQFDLIIQVEYLELRQVYLASFLGLLRV
jgi:hypothetical protein